MGRFNWIWKTLRTLSVVMCGVWLPSTASAFSTNELKNIQLGSCRIEGLVDTNGEWWGAGIAIVSINLTSSSLGPYRYSGGAFWVSSRYTQRVNIDLDTIETCLGIAPGEVTNLIQTGADNSKTFVNQTNMGFTFSISDTVIRYPNDSNYVAGGTYSFYIGAASNAPTNLATTPGDGKVSVAFTAPTDTGGSAITDYEYQLDGGDWTTAITTSSPVVITGLKNGTSYSIKLRAVNIEGVGAESAAVTSTPAAMQTPSAAFAGLVVDQCNYSLGDGTCRLRSHTHRRDCVRPVYCYRMLQFDRRAGAARRSHRVPSPYHHRYRSRWDHCLGHNLH